MSTAPWPPGLLERPPPDLPDALHGLGAPCYLHRTPPGRARALALGVGAVAAGLLVLIGQRALSGRAGVAELLAAAFIVLTSAVLVSRGRRGLVLSRPLSLAADRTGLWFVGAQGARRVPWAQVESMEVALAGVNSATVRGVVIGLSVSAARDLGLPTDRTSRRRPLGQPGIAPEVTLGALAWLRAQALEVPDA